MFVKGCLHLELLRLDPAIPLGIVLVDELDSKDWVIGVDRRCLLDAKDALAVVEREDWFCGQA